MRRRTGRAAHLRPGDRAASQAVAGRHAGRLGQPARRQPRGLRRAGRRRPGDPADLLEPAADPAARLGGRRPGGRDQPGVPAVPLALVGLCAAHRRRPGRAAALRPDLRPGPPTRRRDRPAVEHGQPRSRHVEAVPRRHARPALDRRRRQRRVRALPRRARRPARRPGLGRRPAGVPLRPRGPRQRLLGGRRRHRPAPAQRPHRQLRARPRGDLEGGVDPAGLPARRRLYRIDDLAADSRAGPRSRSSCPGARVGAAADASPRSTSRWRAPRCSRRRDRPGQRGQHPRHGPVADPPRRPGAHPGRHPRRAHPAAPRASRRQVARSG